MTSITITVRHFIFVVEMEVQSVTTFNSMVVISYNLRPFDLYLGGIQYSASLVEYVVRHV